MLISSKAACSYPSHSDVAISNKYDYGRCYTRTPAISIVILDFAEYLMEDEEEQEKFCQDLIDAFRHEAFAKLRNHEREPIQQRFDEIIFQSCSLRIH
jgi:hypothetical protein